MMNRPDRMRSEGWRFPATRSSARRVVAIGLVAIVSCGSLGCGSAIGAIVGAQFPDYEKVPRSRLDSIPAGTEVRVTTRDGVSTTGALEDVDPVTLVTEGSPAPRRINPEKVESVEKRDGTHWDEGLAIGLAVDVTLVLVAAAVVGPMWISGGGLRGFDPGPGVP